MNDQDVARLLRVDPTDMHQKASILETGEPGQEGPALTRVVARRAGGFVWSSATPELVNSNTSASV